MKPCILLLSPGIIKWTDLDFGLPHLVSIGGYLRQHLGDAVRIEILDVGYEGGDHRFLERKLRALEPLLCIGVSCFSSFDYMRVATLGRFLRGLYPGREVPLVTGGYHASARPGDLSGDFAPFDAVVVGEGELPMLGLCRELLGGGDIRGRVYGPEVVPNLDDLPPYAWDLLSRYWPRATEIGRKLQIFLSRGCPYKCTFCMERAKSEYHWRAYSPERAVDELARLATFTDLGQWVVNLADPLFGFQRSWRRAVTRGIIERGLEPRQFWTLTRSDDLDEEDIELFAKARFSLGIGLESGSPRMLRLMRKTKGPERYLEAALRLGRLSRDHGLNWATNIIVGHPGETRESLAETRDFVRELFVSAKETCGWLSIDPFRLYPGSWVHETMPAYEADHGTRFHHKRWWHSWYDASFRAEHIDPSSEVSFEDRVRFVRQAYAPITREIGDRFRGQGRSIDRVFRKSLLAQEQLMSAEAGEGLLRRAERVRAIDAAKARRAPAQSGPMPVFPLGLQRRDPHIRRREEAIRRLLETGTLRADALVEALLVTPPERYLQEEEVRQMLGDRHHEVAREGDAPRFLGLSALTMALEALEPGPGDRAADLFATSGYVAALLVALVGPEGHVRVLTAAGRLATAKLRALLRKLGPVEVVRADGTSGPGPGALFDRIYGGGALPRAPRELAGALAHPGGRAVTFLGPRFRAQDMVCLTRKGDRLDERIIARARVPVIAGARGWVRSPRAAESDA